MDAYNKDRGFEILNEGGITMKKQAEKAK